MKEGLIQPQLLCLLSQAVQRQKLPPLPSSNEDMEHVERYRLDGAQDLAVAEEAYESLIRWSSWRRL